MRCDQCQALLLDYLYGLLDGPEKAALAVHLADCPGCAAARSREGKARDLFARAARFSFPEVRFTPPADAEPAVPAAVKGAVRRDWTAWASVAVVLVLVPGAVLPVRQVADRYDAARRAAAAAAARLTDARSERDRIAAGVRDSRRPIEVALADARKRHNDVLAQWVAHEVAAEQAERTRKVAVELDRPAAVQPGAPNEVAVIVKDASGLPAGRVEAEVRDQDDRVVAMQVIDPTRRDARQPVKIPAAVWAALKPQSELYLTVAAVDEKTMARTDLLAPVRLFGPVYATMLATDKAAYRPGETVHFRSLTLDRISFRPPDRDQVLRFELRRVTATNPAGELIGGLQEVGVAPPVRVTGEKVESVHGPDGKPVRGIGCGSFVLPADLADGDYTLVLTEEGPRTTIPVPVTRTVRVRSGLPEKFAKKIGFHAASFAPGQLVEAWAELKLGDKPVPGAKLLVAAEADGVEVAVPLPKGLQTGSDGRAAIKFPMPRQLPRGDVRLKVTFEPTDGSRPESVAERVPVTGKEVVVEFFPEGGDLIAGVPCQVYVRATTAAGRPVDVRGTISDGTGPVARIETATDPNEPGANRGLGTFTFTPQPNTQYVLNLEQPVLAAKLPEVQIAGVAMHVPNPVPRRGEPFVVRLHSPNRPRTLMVGAYTRGRLADTKAVEVEPGKPGEVTLMGGDDPRGGVTRITVFETPDGTPVAERLVFRQPGERLDLGFTPAAGPDGRVDLSITAKDEAGKSVPAVVWVAAVNSAVAPGAKDRLLPTHFLLAGEVQTPDNLEYADFLLTDNDKARQALDRVLATQGWRRFAEQQQPVDLTLKRNVPFRDAERLQVLNGQYRGGPETPLGRDRQRAAGTHWPAYEDAAARLDAARKAKDAKAADRSWAPAHQTACAAVDGCQAEATSQLDAVKAATEPLTAARKVIWAAVGALVMLGGAFTMFTVRGRRSFGFAAVGALGLAGFLLASESAIAARAAESGLAIPKDAPIDPTEPVVLTPNGPPDTPNGVGQPPPGVRPNPGGSTPLLTERNAVLDRPPPIEVGPGVVVRPWRLPPSELILRQRAAEKAAAAGFADDRARAIRAKVTWFAGQPEAPPGVPDVLDRLLAAIPRTAPLVVREYAAPRPAPAATADDPDTVLWMPVIVLPSDGQATVSFHAGRAEGGYQILVAGHTLDGRLGAVRGVLPGAPAVPVPPK